ncbi:hypothetical protein [Alkalicoccobacillus murimartini]|uniref:Voltage-gated potassium channel Kch n=1 Tax=Alkalicoccobacillus murimartini TaxID=171685 RepID=A0ABT9YN45_9BACI|nr:hypothetical protein [Alkalicoccobacillus murimartini]MDQ0209064.1 voltage-gated potassium channel Kch [Alkalicoccobacillus murimartini]
MINVLGKQFRLDKIIFSILFLLSIGIICLNLVYALAFGTEIVNMNMGIGVALIIYSGFNLFKRQD